MPKVFKLSIFTFLALIMIACAPVPTKESLGEYVDASAITAKVKTNLLDALGPKALGIQVATYKDEVQLSGFVESAVVKRHAGITAVHTIGVKQVRNNLIVK